MINCLRPYPVYKDSGVSWLGRVPAHWDVTPSRALFCEVKDRNHPNEEMLSVTITRGVIRQQALLATSPKKDSSNQDKTAYKLVQPGNIAYNKMRAWQGAVGMSDYRGIISPAYVVVRLREGHHSRYFHYLLRTPAFAKEAERWSYGITSDQWSLRPEHFKMIYCSIPSRNEQSAIVRFLDHADRLIQRYIRAKKALITLLNEQKQVIILRAVTRGTGRDVRLKPSGVEWIGSVPEHWGVLRVKHVTKILRGKFSHRPRNDPSLYDGPFPFIQTGDVARAAKTITSHKQTLNERGLAVSKMFPSGTLVMTIAANIGDVAVLDFEACFPDSIVGFVPCASVERDYLYYVFRAMKPELLREAPVNTQGNLNVDRIGSRRISVPPLSEQQEIVCYIERSTAGLNQAIERAMSEITLVREYRTRLIADVVTGKLDVREAVARLPEAAEEPELLGQDEAPVEDDGEVDDANFGFEPEETEA